MEKQKKIILGFVAVVGLIISNVLTVLITLKILEII